MVNVDRIKELANQQGLKLCKLQELIGVSRYYLSDINAGKYNMPADRVQKIAQILGTSYEYLTNQTDDPSPELFVRSCPYKFNWYRFGLLCMEKKVLQSYVESHLNLPNEYLEGARIGKYNLRDNDINIIAAYLDTTYAYLTDQTDDPRIPDDDRTGVKIKLFGEVAAGIPIKQIDNFDPDDDSSWEEINRTTAKNGIYFALRIKGDSMETRIKDGDRVIVRYQETVESGQTAVVAINGDTATCKKVIWDEEGGMILMSNNPAYAPRYFTAEQIQQKPVRILGRVVEIRGEP